MLSLATRALFILSVLAVGTESISDPCSPEAHGELNQKERSTGYTVQYPATPLCDISLQPGWYRFTSAAGGMMPEICPSRLQCGTVAPVWMNGSHPSVADGMVSRQACANFHSDASSSTAHPCCEHSVHIGVKNCGDFYVYYLQPTPTCPVAYCAEAFPQIDTDPVLSGPKVVGRSFHFSCRINYPAHDPDLAFEVLWTFDGQPDPNIPAQTLRDPAREAQLDGALLQGHLGTNVGCQIRARYMTHVNMSSPWLKSQTYWAGIREQQTHVTISEKEETKNVTLVSTIPILCDHDAVCCLTLKVDVDGPRDNVVTAHACVYELCSEDWDPARQEARVDVPITASKDQILDGDKDLMLAFEDILSSGGGPYLRAFDGFRPGNVPVDAVDADTKSCSWIADPHVHAMNLLGTFGLYKVGDYTMIENPNRHMEARTWPCNEGRATCICGVTIREKDDVIRINQCDQPFGGHHTSPTVRVASGLREGTVIRRSTDGNQITVYLPSGMEVKVEAAPTALNAYLTVPSSDAGGARGICGTFDGISGNEFTRRDGGTESECSGDLCVPERFTESWKNPPNSSLFETLPPRTDDMYVPRFCSCDKDVQGQPRINCTARGDIPRHTLKCSGCPEVQGPLPSFMDPAQAWSRRRSAGLYYVDLDQPDPAFDVQSFREAVKATG
ncbi:von Willebrand factor D and EGF domain-containing protein-like [Babylonia areolata]|uniref:von Willebrand factor D and EGF domain-containing protein-like n=1 Tax=Babylonia areolata TaxID=304850 RepID=UPI003FD575EA